MTPVVRPGVFTDLTGSKFGRLVVVGRVKKPGNPATFWECRCDCGTVRVTRANLLTSGRSTSCGCYQRDRVSVTSRRHGHTVGGKLSPEYTAWASMVRRCHNPKQQSYALYGAVGIVVCQEWRDSFPAFLAHIGPMPQDGKRYGVDRIDNYRGYEPGNVRWADAVTQANNKRNNRTITYDNRTQTVSQWSRETGLTVGTIIRRLNLGWTAERTLTVKPKPGGHY